MLAPADSYRRPVPVTHGSGADGDVAELRAGRRDVLAGGAWSAASMSVPLGATLVLSVTISRRLGADQLGTQALVAYVQSLLIGVVVLSSTEASMQALAAARGAGDDGRAPWLARWSLRAHLAGGAVVALVLASVGLLRDGSPVPWLVVALTALVDAAGWGVAARIVALEGWRAVGARRLVSQVAAPVLGVAAVLAGAGVTGVFLAQALASTALLVGLLRVQQRLVLAPVAAPAPPWRPLAAQWSLFAGSLLITQIVERRPELVFLDVFSTQRHIAMYAVGSTMVAVALTATAAVTAAAMPAVAAAHAGGERERLDAVLGSAARVMAVAGLLLGTAVAVLGPSLVLRLYGPGFRPAAALVPWLALRLLAVPVGSVCSAYLIGVGRLRPVLRSGGTGAVLDLVLCLLLVPRFDEAGAVVANVVAQLVTAGLLVRAVRTQRHGADRKSVV